MKLPRQLDGGFGGFRAAGSEIHAATIVKIWRRHLQEASRELFSWGAVELRGVREGELRGLLGHGAADFRDAVTDVDYRGLARSVQKAPAVVRK